MTARSDRVRAASAMAWLESAVRDVRFGLRQLRKAPVLVSVAVVSLALGIGANTAIFTLIDAVMLQFLPVKDPGRLVLFYDGIATGVYSGDGFAISPDEFSYPFFEYLQTHNDSFEDLAAFRQSNDAAVMHVSRAEAAGAWERATVHLVGGTYFRVLGAGAQAGRVLQPEDDAPTAQRAAVLSYPFWRDRFRLDPTIIGRTVILNGTAFTVIGVAASEFFGERIQPAPDFWIPLSFESEILHTNSYLNARSVYWLNCLGRLKRGTDMARAEAEVNLRFHQFYLEQAGSHASAEIRRKIESVHISLKRGGSGISALRFLYSQPLHLLMAVVAVVLLIACANIATLLLARASTRSSEFLARLALGASRGRLLRQVLTESILLSLLGGAAGAGFAWWSIKGLILLLHISPVVKVRPDFAVLVFTFALCIATGILFGIFPALKFSRMDLRAGNAGRTRLLGRRPGTGQLLAAFQVALSLMLLFAGSLLAHSLLELERQNLGFERNNILVVRSDASLADYKESGLAPLYRNLGERLMHLPGVVSASIARFTPESGYSSSSNFSIQGYNARANFNMDVYDVPVAPGFFETMGIPLLLGRRISVRDTPGSPIVAVVNQAFVDAYLPHQNPIGRRMSIGAPFKAPGAEIAGVVADSRFYDLHKKAPPMVFFSLWQKPSMEFDAVLRTSGAMPLSLVEEVRQGFRQVDARLPILRTMTLNSQVEGSLKQQKMITTLSGAFGLLAMILTLVGVYGTTAYSVVSRTNEIGIRMAIGARGRAVLWLVLRDALLLITAGLVLGTPLAFAATHWLKSFLFGVQAVDPLAIGSAVLLVIASAMLAALVPAQRAARIDPMRALRHE